MVFGLPLLLSPALATRRPAVQKARLARRWWGAAPAIARSSGAGGQGWWLVKAPDVSQSPSDEDLFPSGERKISTCRLALLAFSRAVRT